MPILNAEQDLHGDSVQNMSEGDNVDGAVRRDGSEERTQAKMIG
jgi:hypothetical protein